MRVALAWRSNMGSGVVVTLGFLRSQSLSRAEGGRKTLSPFSASILSMKDTG